MIDVIDSLMRFTSSQFEMEILCRSLTICKLYADSVLFHWDRVMFIEDHRLSLRMPFFV